MGPVGVRSSDAHHGCSRLRSRARAAGGSPRNRMVCDIRQAVEYWRENANSVPLPASPCSSVTSRIDEGAGDCSPPRSRRCGYSPCRPLWKATHCRPGRCIDLSVGYSHTPTTRLLRAWAWSGTSPSRPVGRRTWISVVDHSAIGSGAFSTISIISLISCGASAGRGSGIWSRSLGLSEFAHVSGGVVAVPAALAWR